MGTLTKTDPADVANLPFGGVCVIRTPDGKRIQACISDATVTRDTGGHGGLRAHSADEVAALLVVREQGAQRGGFQSALRQGVL